MPFQVTPRQTIVFAAGLALGLAAAWAVFGRHPGGTEHVAGKPRPMTAAKAVASPSPVAVAAGACAFSPVVATAARDDGRVDVQSGLAGRSAKEIDAWTLDGKEAVAAGRQRDAEADFLMACLAAEKLGDSAALPQAEAMYNLARHYASLAGAVGPARGGELRRRAESLFAASLGIFRARYGGQSDKTRFAAKGLADVQAHGGAAPTATAAAAPAKALEPKVAKAAPAPAAKPAAPVVAKAPPEPKAAVVAKAAEPVAPKEPEPDVAKAPVATPAPPREPQSQVAAVKPVAPEPASDQAPLFEPPARAVGSATGAAEEGADSGE